MASEVTDFGEIDLYGLLEECNGSVSVKLLDAGMVREKAETYEFSMNPSDNRSFFLVPKCKIRVQPIRIPAKILISPQLLIFLGMYDGDGNKTGNIGFAQNNTELQAFAAEGIEKIFPKSFESRVHILQGTRFFESPDIARKVEKVATQTKEDKGIELTLEEARKVYLLEQYHRMVPKTENHEDIGITISPKKGGETVGKSSYEIIVGKVGSRSYLVFLLYIIKETIDAVLGIKQVSWIHWHVDPSKGAFQYLDVESYVSSGRCRYPTVRGTHTRYSITSHTCSSLGVSKTPQGNHQVRIARKLYITPLLYLFFGIYWAEGTTTKKKLFTFRMKNEKGLGIGFNSSEDRSLMLFLEAISQIFIDPKEIVSCWLVKIGAKYHAECSAIGSKIGVPIARGGPRGQGIARTVEITKIARDWGVRQFPIMQKWKEHFSHVEFTGAGIPRIDIRGKQTAALFFFSLMVDLTFYAKEIQNHLVDIDQKQEAHE